MSRAFPPSKSSNKSGSASRDAGWGGWNELGAGLKIRGRVSGEGDVRVLGEVEGDVKVGGDLELGANGSVTGNVSARAVSIDGALTGDVEAEGAIAIRSSARVAGNLSGTEVSLEEGASFSGRIEAAFDLPEDLGSPSAVVASGGGRRSK